MAYLIESALDNVVDIPIALSSTDLRMGDWVVLASTRIISPMRLTYKVASLSITASSVNPADIANSNKIYGNLGLVYLALLLNYTTGNPGNAGGLDSLVATGLGTFNRDTSAVVTVTTPGIYSWVIANNMQPSTETSPTIPVSTSIDFRVIVTGAARLELDSA